MIKMQASIIGYMGRASSVFAAYDEEEGVLAIVKETELKPYREAGCVLITNNPHIEDRDYFFTEALFSEAVKAYQALKNGVAKDGKSPALIVDAEAGRANLTSVIKTKGYDESGVKFELEESLDNAHVAALALVWFASKQSKITSSLSVLEAMSKDLHRGHYQLFGGDWS